MDPGRDVAAARGAFDDADIQLWHTRRSDSDSEAQEWLRSWRRRWDAETDASWAIARTGGDAAVGQVGLRTISLEGAQAQVSYWVLPEARRQRLAARASAAVAEWSSRQLGLQRLYLQHSVRGVASCAADVPSSEWIIGS